MAGEINNLSFEDLGKLGLTPAEAHVVSHESGSPQAYHVTRKYPGFFDSSGEPTPNALLLIKGSKTN